MILNNIADGVVWCGVFLLNGLFLLFI